MTPDEAAARVAIRSPEHLKQWLKESGRQYVIFKSDDLIDALPWPNGVESFMQLVREYDAQRQQIETGRTELLMTEDGQTVSVDVRKTQVLEQDEINECIAQLQKALPAK